MIFSYNWLKDYVKGRLPEPKKLAEILTTHSFEVTEAKKIKGDWVLDIDVLPNRAHDCFSHLGIAREIAAITNSEFKAPISEFDTLNQKTSNFIKVENTHKSFCPRYTARVVIGAKIDSSPKWIQERLRACGLRPINNIVDIVNYVMLETGQPLHAFDGEKLEGRKIIVRFAKDREKITTLDGEVFNLSPEILVIADARSPVAIAGIKGGKSPEIGKKTKTVVLESANFEPRIIRNGSKKLNLRTDASLRFEHGIDPNLTEFAINRAADLIQKTAGGKTAEGLIDVYPRKVFPKRIKLDLDYLESLLGIKIRAEVVRNILKRLEFKIQDSKFKILTIGVSTRRRDLSIPEDLIEEIGRIYGYEKIPAAFPTAALIPPKKNEEIFWENMVKNILKEAGFTEVYNYSFVSQGGGLEVENPMSREYKYLRSSLIPGLLKNVETNQKYFKEIKIFELGKTFKGKKEKRMLTGVVAGEDFYQLKGIVDLLFNKLGVSSVWYDDYRPTPEESPASIWHPKKCAEIKTGRTELGFLGEIRGETKAVVFDIDFEKLQQLASEEHEYRPISRYPSTIRDLAVLVPLGSKTVEVLTKINTAGGALVRDVDLFDVYKGEELPGGKKNLAFHIIYQAEDRTLKSSEIDKIHQKIIKALGKDPTWQVRK